ncbi:MAG: PKD domain-containing protein [Chloroflexi bacterium]|nr:PKD domain-containing protein [Chloroflexota bacterium]
MSAQAWGDFSADVDGDGLPNTTEETGWSNGAGGPFLTDPLDADSDDDGLTDGHEKLYDTDPLDDHSPGIYVEYEKDLQTSQYYTWQRYGDNYIALPHPFSPWEGDAVVVRRGTTFSVGGPADANIVIDKSLGSLTTLTSERDSLAGRWSIHVPEDGTVGIYTITVEDGSWSESLNLYVIFELPTDLSDAFIEAFVYDDDLNDARDTTSLGFYDTDLNGDRRYEHDDYDWIPEGEWINRGYVWRYDTQHYGSLVFKDHVMPAINGHTTTWDAANDLGDHADQVTCFDHPRPLGNSWCVLNPSLCGPDFNDKNQCTNIANLLTSFNRAAGIPSRPVFVDWPDSTFDHATEVWTKPTWDSWDWYVMRGYFQYERPCETSNWGGGYVPLGSTSGWYTSGQGVYAAAENWNWADTRDGEWSGADDFRLASWQFDKSSKEGQIIKKDWFETRLVDYYDWPSEPEVIGAPPEDWPNPPATTAMATMASSDLTDELTSVIQIDQVVADYGMDLDGDGRFDQLAFDIQVEVQQAGVYWFQGQLAGDISEAIGEAYLEEGRHTITLPFEGMSIYMNKEDGPYVLADLWVTDVDNPAPVDFVENALAHARPAYDTYPYKFGAFGIAGASLSGDYAHRAIDTDRDGYADTLMVETTLKIEVPDTYTVRGVLFDGQGEMLDQAAWSGSGSEATLRFEALRGTVGPYTLEHVHVRNSDDEVTDGMKDEYELGGIPAFSAKAIRIGGAAQDGGASGIQPMFVVTNTGYSDVGVDTDGDSKFDELLIALDVEVEAGEGGKAYRLEGWLADANNSLISWAVGESQVLTHGVQSLSLAFDGRAINEHRVDGPYKLVALKALSNTYEVLDEVGVAYMTSAYDYDAFEPAAVAPAETLFFDDMEDWIVAGESFESGALGATWTISSSTTEGRIQVTSEYTPAFGTHALLMDDSVDRNYTLNEAIWTVDLSNVDEASLSFYHADLGDEQHPFNGDFTGSYNADGVAISDDGVNWHPILSLPDQEEGVWLHHTIDLASEAAEAGMSLGVDFQIKFQQYDNFPLDSGPDGRGWDEILIIAQGEGDPADQWTADSLWEVQEDVWYSHAHAWGAEGSSGGDLTSIPLDLSDYAQPTLSFKTVYKNNTSPLQVSTDGVNWTDVVTANTFTTHWDTQLVNLSDYSETSDVQFRFNADAQSGLRWYVDDVSLSAWPAVITATFDYVPQPALTDEDITFVADYTSIDTTTLPITYTWDFGDGSSILVTSEPTVTHTFTESIERTVYLTVENPYDDALFSDVVPVYEPVSETSFDFTPASDAGDWKTVFTSTYTPTSASQPVTFTWDFGDGSTEITTTQTVTHIFPTTNTYTVLLTTTNGYGGEATATHQVTVPFDNDGDGLTNATEDALGTDPNDPDSDGDGLTDGEEVNTYGTDPNDTDSDDDGLTDYEEVNDYETDPNNTDSDGDGMPDGWEVDNALNPLVDDAADDADNDGLTNLEEYQAGADPQNPDSDGDGMPDGWEVDNNLDPLVDDAGENPDSDALTNLEEYQAGTDPRDYNPSDISLSNASVAENQPVGTIVGAFSTIDPDDDTHSYSLVSGAGDADNESFAIVSATLQTAESFDYETKDNYTIRVQADDGQATISETFAITVTNVNDAPTFTSTPVTTATEEVAYEYTVTAEDVDVGDALTITALTLPDWLDLTSDGGDTETLTGIPTNDDVGEHLVELHVEDLTGETATQAFTITVANVNDAPAFTSAPITTATQDASYSYPVEATDVDADEVLTITAESLPAWLTLVDHGDGTATLSGTPANADVGDHAIPLLVTDAGGLTDTQAFTITVANVNDAPTFTSTPEEDATEDASYTYAVTTEDVDAGDTLTITALTLPDWLDLTGDGGTATLSGTPSQADIGPHAVSLMVTDVGGLTDTQNYTVTVYPDDVNLAPSFNGIPVKDATEDQPYSYEVTAEDPNAEDVLVITAPTAPTWLTLVDHGDGAATLSGTPDNADVGDHAVSLLVTDAGGLTDTQSFTVTVINANDAPEFASIPKESAIEEANYIYNVVAEDEDVGDVMMITAPTVPAWLNVTDNGDGTATLSGTPSHADIGPHAVSLLVTDAGGLTDTQSFTVTVFSAGDNVPPSFVSIPVEEATEDEPYTYEVAAEDLNAEDVLVITAPTAPTWLTLVDHGDGAATLSGTPDNADVGDHAVSLLVTDAGGLTDTQAFTITVMIKVDSTDKYIFLPVVVKLAI